MMITPKSHPDHPTVGHYFKGNSRDGGTEIFFCETQDDMGFWLKSLSMTDRHINISERAVDSTFHRLYVLDPDNPAFLTCRWGPLEESEIALVWSDVAYNNRVVPDSLRFE